MSDLLLWVALAWIALPITLCVALEQHDTARRDDTRKEVTR